MGFNLYFLNKNKAAINTITAAMLRLALPMSIVDEPKKASKIIVEAADAIKPTELERKALRTLEILSIFLCFLKKLYKKIEITKPDKILPTVAATAPKKPAIRIPTKEAVLTTKGPGVICEIVIISVYS